VFISQLWERLLETVFVNVIWVVLLAAQTVKKAIQMDVNVKIVNGDF